MISNDDYCIKMKNVDDKKYKSVVPRKKGISPIFMKIKLRQFFTFSRQYTCFDGFIVKNLLYSSYSN